MPQNAVPDEPGGEVALLPPIPNADSSNASSNNPNSSNASSIITNGAADTTPPVASLLGSSEPHTHAAGTNGRNNGRSQPHASTALQDMFLNGLRRENIDVVVYFSDGSQERGVVRAFDTFTLLLENRNSGKAQLIYKHAITRIFPVRTPSMALDRAAKKREE